MCDTFVYVDKQKVVFAKNSDREVNEPQVLLWQPRRVYQTWEYLKCTHITIPQVKETYAILVSKPVWIWGAEMGTNEFGVTIGNEAVFTNQPYRKTGLTGMDLLRLALERSSTAQHACETIIQLIESYGQGGNCGYKKEIYYHNSYIIADPNEAYVLETADKKYEIEKVQGGRAISNGLTIKHFNEKYSDWVRSYFTQCNKRRNLIEQSLQGNCPSLSHIFKLLRTHKDKRSYPQYHWFDGGMDAPCMHAGGIFLNYQTTASWVSELTPSQYSHWVTATSTPCLSLFKPIHVLFPLNRKFCTPNHELKDSFWWAHEKFQRQVMKNPEHTSLPFLQTRDRIEQEWVDRPPEPETAFTTHEQLLQQWWNEVKDKEIKDTRPIWARHFWKRKITPI